LRHRIVGVARMVPGSRRRRRRTAKDDGPDPIDVYVGRQVRLARELAGMTQTEVGQHIGMSFQVVQKYEHGEIRVSASRLFQFARLLNKPIDYFFESLDGRGGGGDATEIAQDEVELIRAFRLIINPDVQQRLLQLFRGISEKAADKK
jgi:transcriptional regulator with XRE-family HTH domain